MLCSICGEKVVLVPSAQERARKYGQEPSFYINLFPNHADCEIKKRNEDLLKFLKKDLSKWKSKFKLALTDANCFSDC